MEIKSDITVAYMFLTAIIKYSKQIHSNPAGSIQGSHTKQNEFGKHLMSVFCHLSDKAMCISAVCFDGGKRDPSGCYYHVNTSGTQ